MVWDWLGVSRRKMDYLLCMKRHFKLWISLEFFFKSMIWKMFLKCFPHYSFAEFIVMAFLIFIVSARHRSNIEIYNYYWKPKSILPKKVERVSVLYNACPMWISKITFACWMYSRLEFTIQNAVTKKTKPRTSLVEQTIFPNRCIPLM